MVKYLVVSENELINLLSKYEEKFRKRWSEALPGSKEQECIHKQLMEVSHIKKEVILYASNKENLKEQHKKHKKEFLVDTGTNVVKIKLLNSLDEALISYELSEEHLIY